MNKQIYLSLFVCSMLVFFSCSKSHFKQLNENPDQAASVPPYLLLPNIASSSFTLINPPDPGGASLRCHQTGNAQQPFPEQYWNWLQGDYSIYNILLQVHQMKAEAASFQEPEYDAIAKFFDAYNYYKLTMLFGDVPYTQAVQAAAGIYNPPYDSQKSIFQGILSELDSANTELMPFSNGQSPLISDVIYGGSSNDILSWRKLI